jgi:hypothetical protein
MSNYTDLALRLTQIDAAIKSTHTKGASAVRKERQAEKKIVQFQIQRDEAHEEVLKLQAEGIELKRTRKSVIAELQTRAEQVQ